MAGIAVGSVNYCRLMEAHVYKCMYTLHAGCRLRTTPVVYATVTYDNVRILVHVMDILSMYS